MSYQKINEQRLLQQINASVNQISTKNATADTIRRDVYRILGNMQYTGILERFQFEVDPNTLGVSIKIIPAFALNTVHTTISLNDDCISTAVLDIIRGA